MAICWPCRIGFGLEAWAQNISQRFGRRVVKILGFLPNAILACICEATLNASLAWTLIPWFPVSKTKSPITCTHASPKAETDCAKLPPRGESMELDGSARTRS